MADQDQQNQDQTEEESPVYHDIKGEQDEPGENKEKSEADEG